MAIAQNVGGADKVIRILVGIALIAFTLVASVDTVWKVVAGAVAAIALITAFGGFCPLNGLFGINSCRHET